MNKLKNKKGITLIALVVTVVVLIILAGVSINAVIGDDGIIKKAQESANLTKESEAKEIINRTVLEFGLTGGYDTLEDFLKTKVPNKIDSVTNNGDGTLNVSKNGYTVTVENKKKSSNGTSSGGNTGENTGGETQKPEITVSGIKVVADSQGAGTALGEASTYLGNTLYITFTHSITGGTTTVKPDIPYAVTKNGTCIFTVTGTVNGKNYTKEVSVTVNQFKGSILNDINIKIGDSVNYTYDEADDYTLSSTYSGSNSNQTIKQTTGLTWKVINVDKESDTVDIISENPTSTRVGFQDLLGYYNGQYFMNEICKAQYSNKTLGVYARSVNLLDMEKHLTATGITNRNADSDAVKYGTTKTYTNNTLYPSLYAGQKGAGPNVTSANASKISQPDITKGNDPYGESDKIATAEPITEAKSLTGNPLTVTQTLYTISLDSNNYGTAGSVLANSTTFWVAARYVNTDSDYAHFGLRVADTKAFYGAYLFRSHVNYIAGFEYSLRPVVTLPSGILTGEKNSSGAWKLK